VLLMAARMSGYTGEHGAMYASVVEFIHTATLVHDDVLDEAETRRRGRTVNSLRGNETAVMLGDWLISNSFHLCSMVGDPAVNVLFGETTNTLCEGELLQLSRREDPTLDEVTYMEIVRRKTAALVATCCSLGARLTGATDEVQTALGLYGERTGCAFQIQDDVLDLVGEEAVVGKTLGRDLEKGKTTLPVILLLRGASPWERSEVLQIIHRRDGAALLERLRRSGCLDEAKATAQKADAKPAPAKHAGTRLLAMREAELAKLRPLAEQNKAYAEALEPMVALNPRRRSGVPVTSTALHVTVAMAMVASIVVGSTTTSAVSERLAAPRALLIAAVTTRT
jgi:octaprenyl-diphosphate synthase